MTDVAIGESRVLVERGWPVDARFFRFHPGDLSSGGWVGPWVEPGLQLVELVASWNVALRPGAVLDVGVQLRRNGRQSGWYSLGRWTEGPPGTRTSVAGQADRDGEVCVDTLVVREGVQAFRLRLVVAGARAACVPGLAAVMASGVIREAGRTSLFRGTAVSLDVPPLSQREQRGVYTELDGGGESWCSPTALAMVIAFWGRGPSAAELADLDPASADPAVAHAALHVFDAAYGAGNWSFNVAHAARYGLEAFVTRLRSVAEAELFLEVGIPLVLSVAATGGELEGFPLEGGTRGHLLVLSGVTADGDVVVDDPAAPSSVDVRRVYRRDQFERAWLRGSGGITYVVRPPDAMLPRGDGAW